MQNNWDRETVTQTVIACFLVAMAEAETVIAAIQGSVKKPNVKINENSVITDAFPDMDALDAISAVMNLEKSFEFVIYDEEVIDMDTDDFTFAFKLKTIGQFVDLIIKKFKAKTGEINLETQ